MWHLLLFQGNNGYPNAPQCYVTRTLPVSCLLPDRNWILISFNEFPASKEQYNTIQACRWNKVFCCVLRQAEVAQGVPGRLRPRIILTFRHYKGGRSSVKRTRKNPWYSLSEAGSTSWHMVLSGVPRKKSPVTTPGIDPGTVRLVAQRLNHYATPGPR